MSKSLFCDTLCIRNLGRLRNKLQPEKKLCTEMYAAFFVTMKPFKTYSEQIKILQQNGLLIQNNKCIPILTKNNGSLTIHQEPSLDLATEFLKQYGYYNIVNLYNKSFIDSNGSYINDINFFKLASLHEIDSNIKSTLYLALIQAEQKLKTTIAYKFAERYGPFDNTCLVNYIEPYLDPINYNGNLKTNRGTEKRYIVIHQLTNILSKYSSYPPFEHYTNTHHHIPIWVLINKLTFGETKNLYEVLKIQNNIAIEFHTTPSHLRNMIHILHFMRNDCAHGENFFQQSYPRLKRTIQLLVDFKKKFPYTPQTQLGNLFLALIILKYFLRGEDYARLVHIIQHSVFKYFINDFPIPPITNYLMHQLGVSSFNDAIDKCQYLINYKLQ